MTKEKKLTANQVEILQRIAGSKKHEVSENDDIIDKFIDNPIPSVSQNNSDNGVISSLIKLNYMGAKEINGKRYNWITEEGFKALGVHFS